MNIIYVTGILSIVVQILTGIVDLYVLTLKTQSSYNRVV